MIMADVNFISEEIIKNNISESITKNITRKTKRNGKSINLRSLVYDCIRASLFQLKDEPTNIPESMDFPEGFWLMGAVGDAIHEKYQDILGLKNYQYTEKYLTFNTFAPIAIKTKSDGFDTDNHIVYEIKTKDSIPDKPYEDELTQCVYNAWLFAYEFKMPVHGLTMLYANRSNLSEFKLFNYNLIDKDSPFYLNTDDKVLVMIEKMEILKNCLANNEVPEIDNPYVKLRAYGKDNCKSCVYKKVCETYGK